MVVADDAGVPAVSFPGAGPEERVPDVLQWTVLDVEGLEEVCGGFFGEGYATGVFEPEDYPVRYGEQGDTTALERFLGAPQDPEIPPLELDRIYSVSAYVRNRYDAGGTGTNAWVAYFTGDVDGSLWIATHQELCED